MPASDTIATSGRKWRGNATISWTYRDWSLSWTARYSDSYYLRPTTHTVLPNQGSAIVPSQTYHDLFGTWRLNDVGFANWLGGTELQLGIRNLFNKAPPADLNNAAFYSTFGDPRKGTYLLTLKKSFNP